MTEFVKVIFILPSKYDNDLEASTEMQQAFEAIKQNDINAEWCKESDCDNLKLKKNDVIVFEEFEGEGFTKVQTSKSVRVVSPWCLLTCILKGEAIPNVSWPVCSMAMNNCIITCSSLQKQDKKEIMTKIQQMGGIYSPDLNQSTTHLVTDSVNTQKYIKAAENGLKIILPSWVDAVWKERKSAHIHCNDNIFEQYRCPTFHKLVVSSTGFSRSKQIEIKNLVTNYGGQFNDKLYSKITDFLICESGKDSVKRQAAKKCNIKCVAFKWLTDSISKGYAVSETEYTMEIKTSTPTKDGFTTPNFSMISCIEGNAPALGTNFSMTIDNTELTKYSGLTFQEATPLKRKRLSEPDHVDLVDKIDLKQAKKAGSFLDGCGIYIIGFNADQREKLHKILNSGEATRCTEISERITHVLVGDVSSSEVKQLASKIVSTGCPLVNIEWLIDSIKNQYPVDERNYIVSGLSLINDVGSPLSKRGLHILRTPNREVTTSENSQDKEQPLYHQPVPAEEDTLANLLDGVGEFCTKENQQSSNVSEMVNNVTTNREDTRTKTVLKENSSSSAVDCSDSQSIPVFSGLKFIVSGFTETQQQILVNSIEGMSGIIVSKLYKGIADYIVVPLFNYELVKQVATEIVNDLWITECIQEKELKQVQYFHKPVSLKEGINPLKKCVVTITTYPNYERNFLKNLIIQLGGTYQEQFSRIECKINNVATSTHLISPEPSGKKYAAAIKWRLPVINKDWLLECARLSTLVDETTYLVGAAKCRKNSTILETSKVVPCTTKSFIDTNKSRHSTLVPELPLQEFRETLTNFNSPNSKIQNRSEDETIKTQTSPGDTSNTSNVGTPINKHLKNVQSIPFCSQVTPVKSIMATAREKNLLGTPDTSIQIPKPWDHVDTPETPLGAFIKENPSPNLRKQMARFLNTFPEHRPRRNSTPLSELKRQLWEKICPNKDTVSQPNFDLNLENTSTGQKDCPSVENVEYKSPEKPTDLDKQFQHLQNLMTSSGGNKTVSRRSVEPVAAMALKYSQPNTVGWDDDMDVSEPVQFVKSPPVKKYVFMITGIEKDRREDIRIQLEGIGAIITNSNNFDPNCSHVICSKLSGNEKILAGMASGKWILHSSYIDQCISEGKLVDEEPYEYGNPKSANNEFMNTNRENETSPAHYWRLEIEKRGYGIFHNIRAIVIAQKKDALVRILEAGDGVVVEANPPFKDTISATHCLIDSKTIQEPKHYLPLVEQGIYCVIAVYLNKLIYRKVNDIMEYIIPGFEEYYR